MDKLFKVTNKINLRTYTVYDIKYSEQLDTTKFLVYIELTKTWEWQSADMFIPVNE